MKSCDTGITRSKNKAFGLYDRLIQLRQADLDVGQLHEGVYLRLPVELVVPTARELFALEAAIQVNEEGLKHVLSVYCRPEIPDRVSHLHHLVGDILAHALTRTKAKDEEVLLQVFARDVFKPLRLELVRISTPELVAHVDRHDIRDDLDARRDNITVIHHLVDGGGLGRNERRDGTNAEGFPECVMEIAVGATDISLDIVRICGNFGTKTLLVTFVGCGEQDAPGNNGSGDIDIWEYD